MPLDQGELFLHVLCVCVRFRAVYAFSIACALKCLYKKRIQCAKHKYTMSPSYSEKAIATRIATEQKRLGNNGVVTPFSSAPLVGDGPVRVGERSTRSGRVVKNSRSPYKNKTRVKHLASAPPQVSMTVPGTEVPASVQTLVGAPPLLSMTVPGTEVPASVQPLVGAPPLSQVVMPVQVTEVPATYFPSCISVECVAQSCAVRYWERGHDDVYLPLF